MGFYTFLFLALLGTGVGLFPIPEDIIVLSAGVGVQQQVGNIFIIFAITFMGILISDIIIFLVGEKIGRRIFEFKFVSFFLPKDKVEKVKGNDARDGGELETGNGIGQITFVICLKIRCFLPFVNILQAARTSIPPHSHYPDEHFGVSSGSPQKMVLMDWLQTIELADLTLPIGRAVWEQADLFGELIEAFKSLFYEPVQGGYVQ